MISRVELIDEMNRNLKIYTPLEPLKRFGNQGDGGYVMQDDLKENDVFISAGIADDVSWDFDVLNQSRSQLIFQIDPNIGLKPPVLDQRVVFYPKHLAIQDSENSISLKHIVEKISPLNDIVLKIDIEGAEWEILQEIDIDTLSRFREIVIEFHWIHSILESESEITKLDVFRKLNIHHRLIHLHANNWGNYKIIENRPVPDVIECVYVRDLEKNLQPKYALEDIIDVPNHPSRPEIILRFGS